MLKDFFSVRLTFFSKLVLSTFIVFLMILNPALQDEAIAGEYSVYGPRVFLRDTGKPFIETDTLTAPVYSDDYLLKISNGGWAEEYEHGSSAVITLNGTEILLPNKLNQQVDIIERKVTLQQLNELSVEVRGKPGSALVINVIGIDSDLPMITANVSPQANVAGWHNTDVTVTFDCTDAISGIASCTSPITLTNEGENQVVIGTAIDNAGNTAEISVTVNLDKTQPVANIISHTEGALLTEPDLALTGQVYDADSLVAATLNGETVVLQTDGSFSHAVTLLEGLNILTLIATDSAGNSTESYLTVTLQTNKPPVASDLNLSGQEDVAFNFTLSATDPDGDVLSYQLQTQPLHGVISGTAPNLVYTPNTNYNGTDNLTYLVNDGLLDSNVATVSFNVQAVNDAPVAQQQTVTLAEDTNATIVLTATDIDSTVLTYSVTQNPSNGVITGIAPNLTYTPNANFNGTDSFTFSVNDGALDSAVADVIITVSPTNDAPIANAVSVTTNEDTAVAIVLTGNDIEGDTLTYNLVTQPMNGSLSGVAPNLNYTPSVSFNGADSFTFSVNDGVLNSAVVTVSLLIIAVNDEPQITSQANLQAAENTLYTYQVEAIDPNILDTLIHSVSDAPNGATISPITGLLQWTPNSEQAGHNADDNPYCLASSESQLEQRFADVVLAIDISGSMGGETEWIQTLVPLLDAHLIQQNIGASTESNLYGLLTFGGAVKNVEMDSQGALLASASQYYSASQSVSSNGRGTEDGWAAIDRSLQYPVRAGSSKNIILISDEDRDNTNSELTFASLQSALQDSEAVLNTVVNVSFTCGDARPALGLGQNGIGYVADGFGDFDLCENATVNVAEGTSEQDYVALALALGGAAWDLNVLRTGGKDAQSFVKALMDIKVDEIEKQFDALPQADVVVQRVSYANNELTVEIKNRGLTDITSPITIDLFDGSDLVASLTVNELLIGNSQTLSYRHTAINTVSAAVTVLDLEECITNNNQLSAIPITVNVTDNGGLSDTQHFALTVDNLNQAPVITSTASSVAPVGSEYQYQIVSSDPDIGDGLQYQLALAPQGMVIDAVTGLVAFKPTAGQLGTHDITITVTDINGLSDTQTFALTVDNSYVPLRFTSEPPIRAVQSQEYRYQAVVQSDVTAEVTFSLFLAPDGMTVNAKTGEVIWLVPDTAPSEEYPFVLQVADQFGNIDIQAYELIGDFVPLPPVLTSTQIGAKTVGEPVVHLLQYTDDNYTQSELSSFTLLNGPVNASLETEIATGLRYGSCGKNCGLFEFARGRLNWTTEVTSPGAPIASTSSTGTNLACRLPDTGDTDFNVVRTYTGNNLTGRPIAGPLYDSNNNARLDDDDRRFLFAKDGNDYLRALDAVTLKPVWQSSARVDRDSRGTLIDLEGDASAELLFFDASNHLLVINSDGSLRWRSAAPAADGFVHTQAMPVDFDNDGVYEIAFGPSVFDANGNLLWQFPLADQNGNFAGFSTAHPIDFDLDGISEIAYFNQVRDAQGNILWNIPSNSISSSKNKTVHLAFANFDDDPEPEMVVNETFFTGSKYYKWLSLVDNDGSLIWETQTNVLGTGGLAIADVDNDGDLEIYSATSGALFDHNGNTVWQDGNRYSNGLLADIDGDGHLEIIDGSSAGIYILDAASGELIRLLDNRYGLTAADDIMYADIDNDNQGEIVITGRGYNFVIINSANNNWADAASVYSYNKQSIGDINEQLRLSQTRGNYFSQVSTVTPTGTPLTRNLIADVGLADVVMNSVYASYQGKTNGPDDWTLHTVVANQGAVDAENVLIEYFTDGVNAANKFGEISLSSLATGEVARPKLTVNSDEALGKEVFTRVSTITPECNADNNVASAATFDVQVTDSDGLFDRAKFSVGGIASKYVAISSTPTTQATVGDVYQYQVNAQSFNNVLNYETNSIASGLTINSQTGLITWTPTVDQANRSYRITVIVTDTVLGASGYQYFNIVVDASTQDNTAPVITSTAVTGGRVGQSYRYPVVANDAQNDNISYGLINPPVGMSINGLSGLISWTPDASGSYPITVRATDERGAFSDQTYSLIINDNLPPVISSTPDFFASVSHLYTYQVQATDPDGDALTYHLISAPAGVVLTTTGLLSWTPASDDIAIHSIVISVSDGQLATTQAFDLQVLAEPPPLTLDSAVYPDPAEPNEPVSISVIVGDGFGVITRQVWVDGVEVPVGSDGVAIYSSDIAGLHEYTVTATDELGELTVTGEFYVKDLTDNEAPVVSITNISNLDVVTAPKQVIVSVNDANLRDWVLTVVETGLPETESRILASGTANIDNLAVGEFDPTLLMNGQYEIVLQATDINNILSTTKAVVTVEGDLKVGNFSITFEDVNIPVAGLPIVVTRTYDTRQRHEDLDFGYGWSVGYQNMRIHESRIIGKSWSVNKYPSGLFDEYCVEPNGDPIVSIALPDGRIEKFKAQASPHCELFQPPVEVNIEFEAIEGTTSTLTQSSYTQLRVAGGDLVDLLDAGNDVDPNLYQLTTVDGYVFNLDQGFTISDVTTPNGHSITYSDQGIEHSGGKGITFTRDAANRITAITLPDGNVVQYEYDAEGNLQTFTDELNQNTSFTYDGSHALIDIIDANGVTVSRNEYDSDGRLIAQIDADGNRIEFTHDIDGRQEIIRNRRGFTQIFTYDDMGNVLTETNALGETITRTYDAIQNVLSETDALGNTMSWTYDSKRNKLTETNALGHITAYTYGSLNKLLTETDDNGVVVINNTYRSTGDIEQSTNAIGEVTSFAYDAVSQQVSGITDEIGTIAQVTYTSDYPGSTTDSNGVVTTLVNDDMGRKLSETTTRTLANGSTQSLTTSYVYDDKGRLTQTTDAQGNVSQSEYSIFDKETATIDALGRRTEYDYDIRGNLIATYYPDGTSEINEYDEENNLTRMVDRSGNETLQEYDAANRLVKTTFADASFTRNEYDAAGRMSASIDALGNRTDYGYDAAGRQTDVTDALGNITQYDYDKHGNRTQMTDAQGQVFNYEYDLEDRLVKTTYPDTTFSSTEYDARGRKVNETGQAGITTQYQYDGAGRLIKVIDAHGEETAYSYDEQGNKLSQTDALGRTTRWSYDEVGRVLTRTLPMGQVETFSYDGVGNVLTKTDFNSQTTTYSYDINNRASSISYADGSSETFTYDNNGNRLTASSEQGSWTYQYDVLNRLISETKPGGEVLEYSYDAAGNKTQLEVTYQDASTRVESFTYDSLNRLASVTDSNLNVTSYGYDENGNRASVSYANGTSTVYVYDDLNRLTNVSHYDTTGGLINAFNYTLDNAGHRTQIAETNGRTTSYSYDDLYRLLSEIIIDPVNGGHTADYTYDAVGNRLTETANGVTTAYIYDESDRVTEHGTTTYSYDENGNTLSKTDAGITTSYNYNDKDKLVAMANLSVTASYHYNVDGIRIAKVENGQETNFLVDQNRDYAQVIADLDDSAIAQTSYIYGDDLLTQERGGQSFTYHYDGLGSTRLLTNSAGSSSDSYNYEAFGELLSSTGVTENNYLFTGEQFDVSLDNYYLRARYYDQGVGRFTQQDTWMGRNQDPVTLHKYFYANADPVNNVDPSGNLSIRSVMTATAGAVKIAAVKIPSFTRGLFNKVNGRVIKTVKSFKARLWLKLNVGKVQSKLPNSFGKGKLSKNKKGWRWGDSKNNVRVQKGDPKSKYQSQRQDYVQIRVEGKGIIGKNGQKIPSKFSDEAHIPMKEWLKWVRWDSPL